MYRRDAVELAIQPCDLLKSLHRGRGDAGHVEGLPRHIDLRSMRGHPPAECRREQLERLVEPLLYADECGVLQRLRCPVEQRCIDILAVQQTRIGDTLARDPK